MLPDGSGGVTGPVAGIREISACFSHGNPPDPHARASSSAYRSIVSMPAGVSQRCLLPDDVKWPTARLASSSDGVAMEGQPATFIVRIHDVTYECSPTAVSRSPVLKRCAALGGPVSLELPHSAFEAWLYERPLEDPVENLHVFKVCHVDSSGRRSPRAVAR